MTISLFHRNISRVCQQYTKRPSRIQADGGGGNGWVCGGDARQAASTGLSAAAGQGGHVCGR